MDKLITWFDVETVIKSKMFAGAWPAGLIGASVYSDEVELKIANENNKAEVAQALTEWFGPKYSKTEDKIILEFSANGDKRFMEVVFEMDPDGKRIVPDSLKPDFATFSLYPETPNLKGPDFNELAEPPFIWAFYSFKGGVGRTLHMISLVKALSEQEPFRRVLIVDADLEAPGLTWWAEDELGKPEISFLDFLALAHYDESDDYSEALQLTAERLRRQMLVVETRKTKVEHFFLPAFRDIQQLMRMPIRPENVCWESGKEWIIPELLWKLGKLLDVHAVVVDLRAGLSEMSSPLLFDSRVNRVIVTTPSGQSVQGTKKVLEQIGKISTSLKKENPDYESHVPFVILSMIKEDFKDLPDIEAIKQELREQILPESSDSEDLVDKEVLVASLFDENLLYLKNLKGTLDKLDKTHLHTLMSRIAAEWFPEKTVVEAPSSNKEEKDYLKDLKKLKDVAEEYEFAESGRATDFLITQNLKTIARKSESTVPTAVIMGGKGSGKTYTYLQLANLKQWSKFVKKVGMPTKADYGYIWPLLAPKNLQTEANRIVEECRKDVIGMKKKGITFKPLVESEIQTQIDQKMMSGINTISSWRNFWLRLMAKSLSCEKAQDPLAAMQERLTANDTRIVFQMDGLEDYFLNIGINEMEQVALQSLCQSVVNALQEWPENRIGLLIFIRKDLIKSSIKQNFGQFEARYKQLELKWEREEALRLVAWLVHNAAGLKEYVHFEDPNIAIETVSGEAIEKALEGLWGLKLGKPNSREAYTANWVISVLSDFKEQLQARDLVRLIRFAAEKALNRSTPRFNDRLLPPSAIKNALDPCSKHKIEEIEMEIRILKEIFIKIRKINSENRRNPFERDSLGLSTDDIENMIKMGIVLESKGKYIMPDIIRRGLDFRQVNRGRPSVLAPQEKAQNQ